MSSQLMELRINEILNFIRMKNEMTRIKLSKLTGLSKPSVSLIVNGLIKEGIVKEIGLGNSRPQGGRRPIRLSFVPDYALVLSVDVGGCKSIFSVIDLAGNVLHKKTVISPIAPSKKEFLEFLFDNISEMIALVDSSLLLAISVGVAGTVDKKTQIIRKMPAFGLENVDISEPLRKRFQVDVLVQNDVTLAAMGESWIGNARNLSDVLLISIGTGVGAGLVINGEVYTGFTGSAGEIGEMTTDWHIERQTASFFGKLEEWFSGYSLQKFCQRENIVANVPQLFEMIDKSLEVKERIEEGCVHLALAIANAVSLLDPARVLIGGGIGYNQYDKIYPVVDRTLREVLHDSMYRSDLIVRASLEPLGVVIGGCYYAQKRILINKLCQSPHFGS